MQTCHISFKDNDMEIKISSIRYIKTKLNTNAQKDCIFVKHLLHNEQLISL